MIREVPQPGDIGLTSIRGPVGWGIRAGQWLLGDGVADFEHAFIVLDGGLLVEAQPGGARIVPLGTYDRRGTLYVAPAGLTVGQRETICAAARGYLGTPYSFVDYAAIAAHRFRLPVPGLRRFVASSHHMICSQLVDQCYQDAGMRLFDDGRWPGYVTPGDLFQLLARDTSEADRV